MNNFSQPQAWIIDVSMGYGHQRTAFPLRDLTEKIISANDYPGIPEEDKRIWESTRAGYEFISRFKRAPVVGNFAFSVFDLFQRISEFYPKRDLSKPNFALKSMYSLFERGWGKDLIEKLSPSQAQPARKKPFPLVSTFFTPAFMAEFFGYPGDIFCVVCDADIARPWAPLKPSQSKIKYFAPNERVVGRLKLYGINPKNIFLTGYPLPVENIGSPNLEILKENLRNRLLNLDPQNKYIANYRVLVEEKLGKLPLQSNHILTIMFAVGGAGAQREIGVKILQRLKPLVKENKIKVILSAGIKKWVKDYFMVGIKGLGLESFLGTNIEIIFKEDISDYFQEFNSFLRKTDILWTKPSELSFYVALGLPIIIAPPIGSQEHFNRDWLLKLGAGILQENPNYIGEWLPDWLQKGYLAQAALQGFIEAEKGGTFNITNIISQL